MSKKSANTALLTVKNLTARVGDKTILDGLDLTIKVGEFHVLLGPNGSGKSTLASVLAGHPGYEVVAATESTTVVDFAGESLLELGADDRAKAGLFMAFQQPVEVPGVKVLNFLWEAYKTHVPDVVNRQWKSIVAFRDAFQAQALKLGIKPEMIMRGLNEGFSGGEKKRLEIAQLAMLAPRLAVLDEIDSGLDVDALKLVAAGIAAVREQHHTAVLLITHHQRILQYFKPDQVHVMHQGKIVVSGGVELIERIERDGYKSVVKV